MSGPALGFKDGVRRACSCEAPPLAGRWRAPCTPKVKLKKCLRAPFARTRLPGSARAAAALRHMRLGAPLQRCARPGAARPLRASRSGCQGRSSQRKPAEPLAGRGVLGDDSWLGRWRPERASQPGRAPRARSCESALRLVARRLARGESASTCGVLGKGWHRARRQEAVALC